MEVHHHPEIPHGNRKKFLEYVSEGLMIFLAVFMGFIAENIREHISDREKEKNYINSFIIDLKQDSGKFADIVRSGELLIKGQDSLIALLGQNKPLTESTDLAYHYFFRYATSIPIFNATERTINQLTSTGNFRLIENQELADSISNYYDKVKDVEVQANVSSSASNDCFQFAQNIFKLQYGLHPKMWPKKFITTDVGVIEKYANKLTQMRITQEYYLEADIRDLNKNCISLLNKLREERH